MTRGILAGIVATIVLSLLMVANAVWGAVPALDPIGFVSAALATIGLPEGATAAWVAHIVIGAVVYGIAFTALEPILPGNAFFEGIVFGVIAWLPMMLVLMPLSGHALFARDLGQPVILGTLVLSLVYGIALGLTYWALEEREP